jgi:hypothetical protein
MKSVHGHDTLVVLRDRRVYRRLRGRGSCAVDPISTVITAYALQPGTATAPASGRSSPVQDADSDDPVPGARCPVPGALCPVHRGGAVRGAARACALSSGQKTRTHFKVARQ